MVAREKGGEEMVRESEMQEGKKETKVKEIEKRVGDKREIKGGKREKKLMKGLNRK